MSIPGRLAELARAYALPSGAAEQLEALLALVAEDPHAPTTVRRPEEGADVHVADSLSGLDVDALRTAVDVADLGAGAGFPGLVLAIARPEARFTLVEASGRKAAFIERAALAAGADNVTVAPVRAEEWREGLGRYEAITARAVAPLAVLAEYAAPLLALGGSLVAWKGGRDAEEEAAAARAAEALGLVADPPLAVRPFAASRSRHLHVLRKVGPTPERFPRRAGMAAKRPLG